jgi:antirestriction protein
MQTQDTTMTGPAVYVGTYSKYNRGSLGGRWVELEQFAGDREAFLAHCAEIHADEHEPEFMFQDFQGFPRDFYGESCLPERLFAWLTMSDDERELVARYIDATGFDDAELSDAQDHYAGTYRDGADFAASMAEEWGCIPKDLPAWISIDWEHSWEGGLRFDYSTSEHNGETWFFHN